MKPLRPQMNHNRNQQKDPMSPCIVGIPFQRAHCNDKQAARHCLTQLAAVVPSVGDVPRARRPRGAHRKTGRGVVNVSPGRWILRGGSNGSREEDT